MRNLLLVLAIAASAAQAADPSGDVQRLLRDRDQNALELRLRMQQQQYRALNPPPTPSSDVLLRQVERDQQQRLHERLEAENREREARALVPTDGTRAVDAAEDARRR